VHSRIAFFVFSCSLAFACSSEISGGANEEQVVDARPPQFDAADTSEDPDAMATSYDAGPLPECGNNVCAANETEAGCPADCSPDTCKDLAPCASGTRYYIRYTQDVASLCSVEGTCLPGSGAGCGIGAHSFIGMCLSTNPANSCNIAETYGPYTSYEEC
tara:strand:- start:68831 stop:69310 length:480 start_codon:yes stop_codon:yes gene_type:complete